MPEATLLVSAYNSTEFLKHKIENYFAAQLFASLEMIIVDCTGGKELEAIPENHRKDETITSIVFNQRVSVWKAINAAIKLSNSEYVVQANTDDLVDPMAYRKQIDKLNEGADISYFDYDLQYGYIGNYEDAKGASYDHYITPAEGYATGHGLGPFPMWRKSLHDRFGFFDEKLEILSDSLFWDKLSKDDSIQWGHIPERLGVYANRGFKNLESNMKFLKRDQKQLDQRKASD